MFCLTTGCSYEFFTFLGYLFCYGNYFPDIHFVVSKLSSGMDLEIALRQCPFLDLYEALTEQHGVPHNTL